MSNTAFDFLTESFLFIEASDSYKSRSFQELLDELNKYREHINTHIDELEKEIPSDGFNFVQDLTQANKNPSEENILKGSLFLDTYIINDPLYALNLENIKLNNLASKCMNLAEKSDSDIKNEIANKALYMKSLTEGVRCDTSFIKFFPLTEKIRNNKPSFFNIPDLSTDEIETNIYNWLNSKLTLSNLTKNNILDKNLQFSNKIAIEFSGDLNSLIYLAQYQKPYFFDVTDTEASFLLDLNYIPKDDEYNNWIHQEKIKAIKEKYDLLTYSFSINEKFNSTPLFNSPFAKEFAEKNFARCKDSDVYKLGFDLDLIGLSNLSFDKAMETRRTAKESFYLLQEKLKNDSLLLAGTSDQKQFDEIVNQINYRYKEQMLKTTSVLDNLKGFSSKNILSLGLTALTHFVTPAPWNYIMTGISVLKSFAEDFNQKRSNPFYFVKRLNS